MAVENLVAALAGMGLGSLEVLGGFFRFADMGVEQAQMIIERFAPVAFVVDEPRLQSDLVDQRLIAGAITALPLDLQHIGNGLAHRGEVRFVYPMRRRVAKLEHLLSAAVVRWGAGIRSKRFPANNGKIRTVV